MDSKKKQFVFDVKSFQPNLISLCKRPIEKGKGDQRQQISPFTIFGENGRRKWNEVKIP